MSGAAAAARGGQGVLVLGVGGLGGAAALSLAAGGVPRLVIAAAGAVGPEELARSPLLRGADAGAPLAAAAAARLRALFPAVAVEAVEVPAGARDLDELLGGCRAAVDAEGTVAGQLRAGDAALRAGVPMVHGGALRETAQLLTVRPGGEGGCLRCLVEEAPPSGTIPGAEEVGLLGPLATLAGALLGAEALRLVAGERGAYEGLMLVYEARSGRARVVPVPRRPGCTACGGGEGA